jgi:hypothetical protein
VTARAAALTFETPGATTALEELDARELRTRYPALVRSPRCDAVPSAEEPRSPRVLQARGRAVDGDEQYPTPRRLDLW